jgi:signal transduction histidine kinase
MYISAALPARADTPVTSASAYTSDAWQAQARCARTEQPAAPLPLEPFLRTLGHEMRNVMGTIAVSVEVLRSGAGGEAAQRSALDILERQTARLDGVMATGLGLARALEGQLMLSPGRVELGDLVAQVMAALPERCPALALHGAQPAWVEADPIYLAQAMTSLCVATLSARGQGDAGAAAQRRVDIVESGDTWILYFGTAEAAAKPAPAQAAFGTACALPGLSLEGLLGYQIVLLHGGRIQVASAEEGGGFTLALPRLPVL